MSNDKMRETIEVLRSNLRDPDRGAAFAGIYDNDSTREAIDALIVLAQQPESEPVASSGLPEVDQLAEDVIGKIATAFGLDMDRFDGEGTPHSLCLEVVDFALARMPAQSGRAIEVDHDGCTLCGGCCEVETDNIENESVTVPCPECIHREIEAGMYGRSQPAAVPEEWREAIRLLKAFVIIHHGADAEVLTKVNAKLSAAPSIAEKREPDQPDLPLSEGYALLPRELTAENGAKALLIGEFEEATEVTCGYCDGEPEGEDCEACDGSGVQVVWLPVQWTTIKDIYRTVVLHLAKPSIGEKREWINCEERSPKTEDGDYAACVWAWSPARGISRIETGYIAPHNNYTHWMPTGLRRPEPPEVPHEP